MWWLSFADPDLPRGERFLGVCIVPADNRDHAIEKAHLYGCNPGGEVLCIPIPPDLQRLLPKGFEKRLLTSADVDELNAVWAVAKKTQS